MHFNLAKTHIMNTFITVNTSISKTINKSLTFQSFEGNVTILTIKFLLQLKVSSDPNNVSMLFSAGRATATTWKQTSKTVL